jgi:hypothetical protein
MSTRSRKVMFLGSITRQIHRSDTLPSVSRLSRQYGILYMPQSYNRLPRPVTGITLPFYFYFGDNCMCVFYSCVVLWSSGQSSWLQIHRSGFDSRSYQITWEVVGLERSPLSLVSTNEELLGRKSSGSGLEIREYGHRDPPCWLRDTPLSEKSWY